MYIYIHTHTHIYTYIYTRIICIYMYSNIINTHCTIANAPSLLLNKTNNKEVNYKTRIQKFVKEKAVAILSIG